ncbi:MAG: hypothetical protein ABJA93_09975 [Sporichthyaceae bacterium]
MLFNGRRLDALRRMNRDRLTLQISLDSTTSDVHDQHGGKGSWDRAVAGIRIAQEEGFAVKVAATLPFEQTHTVEPLRLFLLSLGITRDHQVIRALAHRGSADHGIELTVETLILEITVTAHGVYWHPVSADHPDPTRHPRHLSPPDRHHSGPSPIRRATCARGRWGAVVPLRLSA